MFFISNETNEIEYLAIEHEHWTEKEREREDISKETIYTQ